MAVQAAKEALKSWRLLSEDERATYMRKIADRMTERADEIALAECLDCGKPLALAKRMDIARAIDNFNYFAAVVKTQHSESHQTGQAALNYSYRSPVGVCGLITPWNLPLYLLTWKVAPALALGNTIVAKPSELTPHTAILLAEVCTEVGLPKGVFNLVHGTGPVVGNAMVAHPDVPLISFTGGTATGAMVGATAAPYFKKVSLELGGKSATVVFDDCDFDRAVGETVRSSFTNAGQVCLCGSRVFVQESIYEKFVQAFVEKVTNELKPGDPEKSNFGALISSGHRQKIEYYVDIAKKEGGRILCGGKRPNLDAPFDMGYFYEPTIIDGLSVNSRCSQEEIFGPVVVVHPFKDEKEVMEYINGTKYGLAGSLWTNDLNRAHRMPAAWETGMVWVNCWLLRDLRVPFGGVKHSGVGREGGNHAIDFWTEVKNVCIKL